MFCCRIAMFLGWLLPPTVNQRNQQQQCILCRLHAHSLTNVSSCWCAFVRHKQNGDTLIKTTQTIALVFKNYTRFLSHCKILEDLLKNYCGYEWEMSYGCLCVYFDADLDPLSTVKITWSAPWMLFNCQCNSCWICLLMKLRLIYFLA